MYVKSVGACAVALSVFLSPCASGAAAAQTTLRLPDAIEMALTRGHRAKSAEATRRAALYRESSFTSRLLPRLTLSGTMPTYNRSIIEVLQPDGSTLYRPQDLTSAGLTATVTQPLPFTGGSIFVSSSLARLSVSGAQQDLSWQSTPVMIGLRQPILRPNTLGWDRREQEQQVELSRRQYLETREDIAAEATSLFFAAYAAQATLANAVTNAAVNDTLYLLNTGRFDIGKIGENDLLQSQLALLRARASVDAAKLSHERALEELELALGMPADTALRIVIPDSTPTMTVDTAKAVEEALKNRSVMSQIALQDVQTRRRVAEAKLNNGMGAVLEASYGFNATAPQAAGAYRDLLEARRVTLTVDVPVLQWGARKDAVRAAEEDRNAALTSARTTEEEAALEARFAALDLAQARRNLELSATADTVARKRFDIAYNRYVIGRISVDNLYIAQNEKDQARNAYVQAVSRYWDAYYRLRRLTLYDFVKGEGIR